MRRKTYRATIINNGHTSVMLVGGYNKPSVKKHLTEDNSNIDEAIKKHLTDLFIKINEIKDFTKFEIYLKQVVYIDGNYIEVE